MDGFTSLAEQAAKFRGTLGGVKSTNIRFHAFTKNDSKKTRGVNISMPYGLCEKAGFLKGDRVDVLVNKSETPFLIAIQRINQNLNQSRGWKVGVSGNGPKGALSFKYTAFAGAPVVSLERKTATVKDSDIVACEAGRIIFRAPEHVEICPPTAFRVSIE